MEIGRIPNLSPSPPPSASEQEDSKVAAYWQIQLAKLVRDGFQLVYTDGSGRGSHRNLAPTNGPTLWRILRHPKHRHRRREASHSDRHGTTPGLRQTICADCRAALATTRDISKGTPCRSAIDRRIKEGLRACANKSIHAYLVWVRANIGIKHNEEADRIANFHSWNGEIRRLPSTATRAGVLAISKNTRKGWRTETSFACHSSSYKYRALAAYTWMRGPQNSWLHRVGKADSPACQWATDRPQVTT